MLILGPTQHGYDFYHQPEWNYRSSPVTSIDLESSDRICSDLQHNRILTIKYLEIILLVALAVLIILSSIMIIYKYCHQCMPIFPSFAARYHYELMKNPSQPPTYTMVMSDDPHQTNSMVDTTISINLHPRNYTHLYPNV